MENDDEWVWNTTALVENLRAQGSDHGRDQMEDQEWEEHDDEEEDDVNVDDYEADQALDSNRPRKNRREPM